MTYVLTGNYNADPATDAPPMAVGMTHAEHNGRVLPMLTELDAMLTYLVRRGQVLSPEEVDDALGQLGRVDGPVFLSWAHGCSLLTSEDLARSIGEVWSLAEYPDATLSRARWLELFTIAGFTVDGHPAARPAEAFQLYRGSVVKRRADWSWTDSLEVAQTYAAGGIRGRRPGKVWTALVTPDRLLARNTCRDEQEYVVNTQQMEIVEYQPALQPLTLDNPIE